MILTLKELSIGSFMKLHYLPALEKFIYHIFYVQVLSKNICGKMRSERCLSIPGDILSVRDYAERLSAHFNLEVQSYHFGNGKSWSIEGNNLQYIDEDHEEHDEFRSYLSDDSRQDASTTHAHMTSMLKNWRKVTNSNQNVLSRKVQMAVVSNIVVVYLCIFFLYYRLTLTLRLIEW